MSISHGLRHRAARPAPAGLGRGGAASWPAYDPASCLPLAPIGWRGRLRPEYARRWPQLAEARWTAPVGDGAASNVGSGCVDPSRAAVTVGTSAAVRLIQPVPAGAELPPLPEQLWRYRVDHEYVVTGAAYSSGGNLFAWAKRELRLPGGAELEAALARVPADGRVMANPRFGGDRPPGLAPAGSGELRGLSFGTTAVDILAGLMTGLCRLVAEDLAVLESGVGRVGRGGPRRRSDGRLRVVATGVRRPRWHRGRCGTSGIRRSGRPGRRWWRWGGFPTEPGSAASAGRTIRTRRTP